jgi:hypothetical protein
MPVKCTVSVRDWFIKSLEKAGLNHVGKHQGPRIHDLRYPNKNKIQTLTAIH